MIFIYRKYFATKCSRRIGKDFDCSICNSLKTDTFFFLLISIYRFTPNMLVEMVPNVGCIVDLTATTRYYDPTVFILFPFWLLLPNVEITCICNSHHPRRLFGLLNSLVCLVSRVRVGFHRTRHPPRQDLLRRARRPQVFDSAEVSGILSTQNKTTRW